jgi:DNA-binding SARP family transcriptional activator
MDFNILGPIEAIEGDRPLALGGAKQRALLGMLLLHANEVVSSDRLIDELWAGEGREEAGRALQVAVSRLRRALEPHRATRGETGLVVTRAPGYELRTDPARLDVRRFESLVDEGRRALAAGDARSARAKLDQALALWRGPPLADLAYESFCQTEIARLEALRLGALEERIDADLALGRHADVVAQLEGLTDQYPLRERLRAQLMLALYRSHRQAEALEAYRDTRRTLVGELGIEPGRELRELEQAMLRQDASLDLPGPVEPAIEPTPEAARGVFVGREPELAELLSGLEDALAGNGRLFLLVGEPGIGKSRLVEELIVHAHARAARVLVGRCWEAGGAPAYWPWVQSLRAYIVERDPAGVREELGAGAGELAQLLPELRELLPDLPKPPLLDPEAARFRLFDAVVSFLTRAAAKRPIVLVLDDLHAADEPSLLLLQFVARGLGDSRLLVVGAYRDVDPILRDPLASTLAELGRERTTRRIALGGFAEPDVGEYVSLTAGLEADPAIVAAIHAQTEGNALFVGEVTRLLIAEGALEHGAAANVGIPRGVHDVIGRRIRRLSEACGQTLTMACVLGREFAIDTLARMIDREPREALQLLDEALEARVVGAVPGAPGRLRFSHALVRDTLYDQLTPARKLRLHAQAGEAIEALWAGNVEPHLAELAYHFAEAAPAGDAERAVDYARRAGDRAAALLAYEEAARLYGMALEALRPAGRSDEEVRCELLLALGDAKARGGAFGAAKDTFVHAAELARELGAADQLARAALGYGGRYVWFRAGKDRRLIRLLEDALEAQPTGDTGLRAMLLARLAGALRGQPVPERRAALTEEAVEIARRLGDPETLAYAIEGTYASISWPRDTDRWLSMATELRQIAGQLGDMEKVFSGHLHAFGAFMVLGDIEAAELEFAEATAVAHELRQPLQLWALTMVGVMRALQVGGIDEAEELVERARSFGSKQGGLADDTTFQYVSLFNEWALRRERGEVAEVRGSLESFVAEYPTFFLFSCMLVSTYSEAGEEEKARAELRTLAANDFQDLEVGTEWFFGASLLAEACERLDEAAHAPRLYEALLPYADYVVITHPEINLGSAARYLGLLASVMGRADDAVRHFERALETNERLGVRPWLARTQADLARTLLARGAPGDVDMAAELARAALETFDALDMKDPAERLRDALSKRS